MAYLAQENREKATSVLQSDMYQNLNLMVQEFLLLVTQELHHLSVEELARKYEHLNIAFNIDKLFPFLPCHYIITLHNIMWTLTRQKLNVFRMLYQLLRAIS